MEGKIIRTIVLVVLPFAVAVGGWTGSWYAWKARVERMEEHHETLETAFYTHVRDALDRMRIGDDGPVDPGVRYGIRLLVEDILREYVTRDEWRVAWERFAERNPNCIPPPGIQGGSSGGGRGEVK